MGSLRTSRRLALGLALGTPLACLATACGFDPDARADASRRLDAGRDATSINGDAPAAIDAPSGACDGTYPQAFAGHHYKVVAMTDALTPATVCSGGGHLAKIETTDEDAFLAPLVQVTSPASFSWTGLSDVGYADGDYHWADGTALGAYEAFPSMSIPKSATRDCVDLASDGSWGLFHCDYAQDAICECDG
jgi:hypothetical protein